MFETLKSRLRCALPSSASAALLAAALGSTVGAVGLTTPTSVLAQSFRFDRVEIVGNQRVEAATILAFANIERGSAIGAAQVNDALQNLRRSGLFEEVSVTPRGNVLVIEVTEFPTINRINIEGNQRIADEPLESLLQSRSARVFSPEQAEADAQAITDAYRQAGRLQATVTPRIIRREDNRVDLVFEVVEAGVVEVERISFVGNRDFSDRRLRRVLESKQASPILRRFIQRDSFVADRLQFDRQVLRDFYLDRGYVDFRINSVNSELTRERDRFFVTFDITEGQQFRVGRPTVTSELPGADADEFAAALRLRPGEIYSPTLIDRNILRLEQLGLQKGIDFLRVEPRVTRNERSLTLDVEFAISRGPRIFVERIDIEGNSTTLDRVIRRQFDTVEGDPFNPRAIRASAERVRALGFFSRADVEAREGSTPDQVIVDVDVEETTTGSLTFGASYSDSSGAGLTFGFSERNFLGRGQFLGFNISTTNENNNSRLTFFEPALLGRDLGYRFAAYYSTSDSFNATFDTEQIGITNAIDFPAGENGRLEFSLRVESNDLELAADESGTDLILIEEAERGQELTVAVGYQYRFDTRDTGLNPDAGIFLAFGQEFAGLAGEADYVRTTASLGGERRIFRGDVLLKAELEGGVLTSLDDYETRVNERFFTSTRVLRGFESRGIGPRSGNVEDGDPLGGDAFAVARFEANFPLGLPEEYGLGGGAFFDVGSVWDLDTASLTGVEDDFSLRAAIGVSLFARSPIGPLRFDFSRAISEEDFDREQPFNFTIATDF